MLAKRCYKDLLGTKEEPYRRVDRIVVRDVKGNHHVFYFDVSAPMNEDHARLEKAYKEMQEGKAIDPKMKEVFDKVEEMRRTGCRSVQL